MITYIKEGKGHAVFENGEFRFWVAGSIRNAKKEAKKDLGKS